MNELDSELIRQKLISEGFIEVQDEKKAELILINTCSVRKKAEEKAIHFSRQMKNNNKTVVMLGCLAQHKGEELLKVSKADLVIGTRSYEKLIDILLDFERKSTKRAICEDLGIFQLKNRKVREGEFSSFVNIQHGCDNFCTFCVVPYTRGREFSRNAMDILNEIKQQYLNNLKKINWQLKEGIETNLIKFEINFVKDFIKNPKTGKILKIIYLD